MAKTMKKRRGPRVRKFPNVQVSECRFDYSKSRPNRFARWIAKNAMVERGPVVKPSGKSRRRLRAGVPDHD